jgi:hypothetical protein
MSTHDLVDASLLTMVAPSIGDVDREWAERLGRDARMAMPSGVLVHEGAAAAGALRAVLRGVRLAQQ